MKSITRDVRELSPAQRQALESAIGEPLPDDERVRIEIGTAGVAEQASPEKPVAEPTELPDIPDWWRIYEGLSDEEIDRLDNAIRQRADHLA